MAANPNSALETWPALFGKPLRDPGVGVIDPVIRTPMDDGFKSRRRFITPVITGSYSLLMTNAKYLLFQSWHQHKIASGSDWFNFQVRAGAEVEWEEVKMTGIYQAQPQQNRYVTVTFSIVQRTNSIPAEATLDAALS
ncbi:hypothetical protein PHACT_12525 [Pseudohongiella acticola]|uniref:Uncharacterized protein n=1 Tax=Pseudohongiella acticola TaxID=1524254 RepID=A0A1E8CG82_9GAMM|nr:hypothetical protein [Pseudohongiella acticola]OFE11376.1 hypothetical protein PHACT_12525 [Pseudohongiella acticola]